MPIIYLHQLTARLDSAFCSVEQVDNDEIKAHLARYLCVLTSGYLEEALRILIKEYVNARAQSYVSNYVSTEIKNLTNVNIDKIGRFLNCFNSDWREEFEKSLTEEEKDAVNSVIANRHGIAHGQNVGISYIRIKDWYKCTKSVVEKIRIIVGP